jgi:hypothetical protein
MPRANAIMALKCYEAELNKQVNTCKSSAFKGFMTKEGYSQKMEALLGAKNLHPENPVAGPLKVCENTSIDPKGLYKKYYEHPTVTPRTVILSIRDMPCRNPVRNR